MLTPPEPQISRRSFVRQGPTIERTRRRELVQVGPLAGPYRPDEFLSRLAPDPCGRNGATLGESALVTYVPPRITAAEVARLRSALVCIPADSYDLWVRVGMALHWTGWGEPALRIWNEWSRTAPEKYEEADQLKTWESFSRPYSGQKLTLATLYAIAKEHGWDGGDVTPTVLVRNSADAENDKHNTSGDTELDAEIARLAKLPRLIYERERKAAAERFNLRTSVLDKVVDAQRGEGEDRRQGHALELFSPEVMARTGKWQRAIIRNLRAAYPLRCNVARSCRRDGALDPSRTSHRSGRRHAASSNQEPRKALWQNNLVVDHFASCSAGARYLEY